MVVVPNFRRKRGPWGELVLGSERYRGSEISVGIFGSFGGSIRRVCKASLRGSLTEGLMTDQDKERIQQELETIKAENKRKAEERQAQRLAAMNPAQRWWKTSTAGAKVTAGVWVDSFGFFGISTDESHNKAKLKGQLRSEGKYYVVAEGDIMEFLFNI